MAGDAKFILEIVRCAPERIELLFRCKTLPQSLLDPAGLQQVRFVRWQRRDDMSSVLPDKLPDKNAEDEALLGCGKCRLPCPCAQILRPEKLDLTWIKKAGTN